MRIDHFEANDCTKIPIKSFTYEWNSCIAFDADGNIEPIYIKFSGGLILKITSAILLLLVVVTY